MTAADASETRQLLRRGAWVVIAWALGAWGPVAAVWPPVSPSSGWAGLVASGSAVWALALALRPRPLAWLIPIAALAMAAGAALTVPTLGRGPIVVSWAGVAVAAAALTELPPLPWGLRNREGRAWPAVPFLVAGEWWWASDGSMAATVALLALAGLVVVACGQVATIDGWSVSGERWVAGAVRRAVTGARSVLARAGAWPGRFGRWVARAWSWSRREVFTGDRRFVAAVVVGASVRTLWVVTKTTSTVEWYSLWNLRFARQFAELQTPSYGGYKTAYWPVGYGATLSPLQWVSARTGWLGLNMAASVLNVVAGTLTIVLVAALAARWFGAGARTPTAWLMALAAGHVYATSAAVAEVVASAVFVFVVLASTVAVDSVASRARPWVGFVGVGLAVGYASLLKDFGAALVFIPCLCLRARQGSWRGGLRATVATLVGALVLLGPWAVRNGVQVGLWSPFSTVNADTLCFTTYDGDWLKFLASGARMTTEQLEHCYRNSPLDNPDAPDASAIRSGTFRLEHPDEARWYRTEVSGFLRWLAHHPQYVVVRGPLRIYETAGNDNDGGLTLATQSGEATIAGPLAMLIFRDAANCWYYLVLGLSVVGLLRLRSVRRAIPLWAIPVLLAVYTIPGPRALSRHFFIAYPFLAVMAGGVIAALGVASEVRGDPDGPPVGAGESADEPLDESAPATV